MVTKFNYYINEKGQVARKPDYSFTAIENLGLRLNGVGNESVISSIAASTLKGESERDIIAIEDTWFQVQTNIQDMDAERASLEVQLTKGDKNGNPLTPATQENIAARIADLKEGTLNVTKEFYNHYTRETISVNEVIQTPYTIALETRTDLEASTAFLAGLRGETAPARPVAALDSDKESDIRKVLVRQKIDSLVGDDKDLIADMSHALSALIKQVGGATLSAAETADVQQYVGRQAEIAAIMDADYV